MIVSAKMLRSREACAPGDKWFTENHPDGIELDALVAELEAGGNGDWIGWLATSLGLPLDQKLQLLDKASPASRGRYAVLAKDLSMEQRVDLVRRSEPRFVGLFLRDVAGAPKSLIELCDDKWKKKLTKLLRIK